MSEKEKTLKVVDRRMFTADGELREEARAESLKVEPEPPAADVPPKTEEPPVPTSQAFLQLLDMLGQTAAMYLQGFPDPATGRNHVDLPASRQIIESLQVLRDKTAGRLSFEENDVLEGLLGQLQMAFTRIAAPPKANMPQGGRPVRKA